jgi:hypothetical protein
VNPDASRRKILSDPVCRVRGCGGLPTGHHLVPRGSPYFGDDVEENIVPLCGSGTTGHHGRVERYDPQTCLEVGEALAEDEIGYVLAKLGADAGREFLLRRYRLMVPTE